MPPDHFLDRPALTVQENVFKMNTLLFFYDIVGYLVQDQEIIPPVFHSSLRFGNDPDSPKTGPGSESVLAQDLRPIRGQDEAEMFCRGADHQDAPGGRGASGAGVYRTEISSSCGA